MFFLNRCSLLGFNRFFLFPVHDFHDVELNHFDTAHRINHLSFGNEFPGKKHPLDGKDFTADKGIYFRILAHLV